MYISEIFIYNKVLIAQFLWVSSTFFVLKITWKL